MVFLRNKITSLWVLLALNLNPASPKNQLITLIFIPRFVTYDLPLRGMSMDIGFFYRYTPGIAKISGNWWQSVKLNLLPARRLMRVVDFGVYLSGHEPKPTATQSSQT